MHLICQFLVGGVFNDTLACSRYGLMRLPIPLMDAFLPCGHVRNSVVETDWPFRGWAWNDGYLVNTGHSPSASGASPNGQDGPKADRQLSSEKAEKRTFNG